MATFEENEQSQPPSLLQENAASDDLLSVSVPYNNNNNNNNNIQLSSLPTMFMNPTFPDTLYDQELETQFGRLNISSNNPTHHHHQSHYYGNFMLNNNGGVGSSVLGNNQSLLGFDDYCLRFEELQRMRVLQSDADADNGMGYMQQQQQGFFNGAKNLRFLELPRSSNNNYHSIIPRSLNTNSGLQNPYEYFGGVLPSAARNGCTHGQYNVYRNASRSFVNNGENPSRYLLSSMGVENDRVHQARQRARFSDLKSLRGSIFLVAKDQDGCRFLQKRVEEKKSEEIEMIFREVRVHVRELMVDQFGNFVMQKLFEVCNVQQMNQLLVILVSDLHQLLAICIDSHGTRTMQKFLEYLTTDQQRTCLASTLQHITLDLCKNTNGHHVIRHCLKLFNIREIKQILDVVVLHCIDIATDKSGCCVLQQCVEHAQGEHRARLVDEITKNVLLLSESRYGNYVVQYLLGLKIRRITNDLLSHLKSHFVSLSMNKFGSNVVEKCLKEADGVQADQIILEIISHNKFLMVLQDSYGNYVAQSALERAQGPIRDQMIRAIQNHYPSLHSHPHGKRVFARAKSNINKQRQPNNSFDDMF